MLWSGIPAAISVDSVTVKEDDWTGKPHPNKQQTAKSQTYTQKWQTTSGTFHNRVASEFKLDTGKSQYIFDNILIQQNNII